MSPQGLFFASCNLRAATMLFTVVHGMFSHIARLAMRRDGVFDMYHANWDPSRVIEPGRLLPGIFVLLFNNVRITLDETPPPHILTPIPFATSLPKFPTLSDMQCRKLRVRTARCRLY